MKIMLMSTSPPTNQMLTVKSTLKYVKRVQGFSQNTLGGLLSQGFEQLSSKINSQVVNKDLQNALNSLSGSLQDSADQALGGNAGLSLQSIGQQIGRSVLANANNKYDLQNKINSLKAELEN